MGAPPEPVEGLPVALTIAGSDSGGGAGIEADLKTFFALGCHGTVALTALTAQNTVGVNAVHQVPPAFVRAQVDAVAGDIGIDAAKTGMLASGEIVEAAAYAVKDHGIAKLVVDPVFVSKHRDRLLTEDAVDVLKNRLIPLAEIVTPNLLEAGALLGTEITTLPEMRTAAKALALEFGPRAVLIKGGHLDSERAIDVFYDGATFVEIEDVRIDTQDTHGTGCTLAAAIAARLAHGDDILEAVQAAKRFVTGAIRRSIRIGKGFGPVNPGWDLQPRVRP